MLRFSQPRFAAVPGAFASTAALFMHPKKTAGHRKRTNHTERWYRKAKPSPLSAKTFDELPDRPSFPEFAEEVDRPHVPPPAPTCFQSKKPIDMEFEHALQHIWVPSGDAKQPTAAGYFFHKTEFACAKCRFRFYNNRFYSQDGKALCINCALGRPPAYPYRFWHPHSMTVTPGRLASRVASRQFPRHPHHTEFLNDPES
jgi:hypothetical protein